MKSISLYLMAALYVAAGTLHFLHPETYLRIMPPWLPAPEALVWISGACEIVFGVLFLFGKTRSVAAWLIIILLAAVSPANAQMALNWHKTHHPMEWIAWLRLSLQGVLVWWAYIFTTPIAEIRQR